MPDSVHLTITTLKNCDRHRNVSLTEIRLKMGRGYCRVALRLPGLQNRRPAQAKRRRAKVAQMLNLDLGTQLDNPVGWDLELVWGAQGVTLQHQVELAAQAQIPWAFTHDQ